LAHAREIGIPIAYSDFCGKITSEGYDFEGMTPHQQSGGLEALKAKATEDRKSKHDGFKIVFSYTKQELNALVEEAYTLGRADRDEEVRVILDDLETLVDRAWGYVVYATNNESWSKDELKEMMFPSIILDVTPPDLHYCTTCIQMTNHHDSKCQKCGSDVKDDNK
jgi:hypothetical protein